MMKKTLLVLLLFLIFCGCSKSISEVPTLLETITFSLKDNIVIAEYVSRFRRIDFKTYNYEIVDKNEKLLCTFLPLEYDLKNRIIYGRAFTTVTEASHRKKFVIGKGEIIGNEFKAIFPPETKFIIIKNVSIPFGYVDMLKIKLPYSFEEIQWIE
jgi:hypothetical protein